MKKRKDGDRVDKDTLGKYNRGKQNRFKVSSYKLKVVIDLNYSRVLRFNTCTTLSNNS